MRRDRRLAAHPANAAIFVQLIISRLLTPLFGQALARQVAQIGGSVLEVGAGSGTLAADLLLALEALGALPERYAILELSGELLMERRRSGDEQTLRAHGAVHTLLAPGEMGELFKVIALGRGLDEPLLGFLRGDRRHAL